MSNTNNNNNNNKNKTLGLSHIHNGLCNYSSGKTLDYCGCCEGIKTFTPANIENPPSLSSLRYRIGTHGMFKTSMLANLSREKQDDAIINEIESSQKQKSSFSRLSKLTTREDNDLAIAIIDAWATIADVITFYQERIANEGFLRTSRERMSVLELARSIGYKLGPGVASDTFLSFQLEENNPTIEKSIIEIGTKVQSIPQQGEMPQTFETIERLEARPELNEIKANTILLHTVDENTNTLYFDGLDTKLRVDDRLLIIRNKNEKQIVKFFAKVLDVKTDEKKNITITKILIIWPAISSNITTKRASAQYAGASTNIDSSIEMNSSQFASMAIQRDVSERELIDDQNKAVKENLKSHSPTVYAFRQKAAIFGHDAPSYEAIILDFEAINPGNLFLRKNLSNWDSPKLHIFEKVIIHKDDDGVDDFENYSLFEDRPIIFLDSVYENIITTKNQDKEDDSNNWVVFSSGTSPKLGFENPGVLVLASQAEATTEATLIEYRVTGTATGIQIKTLNPDELVELKKFIRRNTTVFFQSEKLELAGRIDETPVQGDFVEMEKCIIGLKNGQVVIITGEIVDETGKATGKLGTEYRKLREITTKKIFFDMKLDNKYLRESVRIYANIARATHGETKREVLGSGDQTLSQQSFTLKQKPLTYIKASTTPIGASSTLEVRVDNILWREIDYLYGASSKDRVFVTKNEDDGSTIIFFGDGKRGSKPFIGVENITAKYRTGTGSEGLLKQNQLSLLIDRPLGVKSVTNPFSTSASQDPENLESAKTNATLRVLTMDRIVSISDFENFARSFAGIGKAKASKIWNGNKILVHLSIASSSGNRVDTLTSENITRSIERFKDLQLQFVVDSFIKKTFSLTAKIKVSEDMLSDKVLISVKNMILDTFSFEKRQFGQPVTLSEVVTLIQNIEGVVFVDLDQLDIDDNYDEIIAGFFDKTSLNKLKIRQNKPEKYLSCSSAYYDDTAKKIIPAEMLIVNPLGVKLLAVD